MKMIGLAMVAMMTAASASAQTSYNPGVASVLGSMNGSTHPIYNNGDIISDSRDTPTMRKQRLVWAAALRDQALRFQAEDGGVISDHHARYIERRIDRLLLR